MPKDNNINSLIELYEIISINTNNFTINKPHLNNLNNTIQTPGSAFDLVSKSYSKYKLKHKTYNIVLPHEFVVINSITIQFFIDKYKRRIERFYNLNQPNNRLFFVRLGLNMEKTDLFHKLCTTLDDIFNKTENKIKFINSTELSNQYKTTNWTRSEYDWINLLCL